MSEIVYYLLILLLLPYLLVPVLIRRNQYFSLKPNIRPVINGFLPVSVESYFDKIKNDLSGLGFDYRIDVISLDYGPNLRVFMRLYVAHKRSMIAIATSLLPDKEKNPIRNFIEFNSYFSDGYEVSTHNSDLIGAPIEPRQKITSALPFVEDVNILFAFHERVVVRSKLINKKALTPTNGSEFDLLVDNFKKDLSYQVSLGCLRLDKANNCYRPTWAGAFLMGWYSMWPLSLIRRLIQKIKAKIQVRALKKIIA
jgi:hypothetical protein